ncbi:MAG: hypothetical protein R3B06_26520 [Kofleriaceae bacterium]
MTRAALTLVATVAIACGGKPAPATPPPSHQASVAPAVDDQLAGELADALLEVLATMVQISHEPDCATMGRQLGALFDGSRALVDQVEALGADPDANRRLTTAMDARAAAVAPLIDAMGPGLVRCRAQPEVTDAMGRMPTFGM